MSTFWVDDELPKRKILWGKLVAFVLYLLAVGYVAWVAILIFWDWNWP